jgi:hypothetical protein
MKQLLLILLTALTLNAQTPLTISNNRTTSVINTNTLSFVVLQVRSQGAVVQLVGVEPAYMIYMNINGLRVSEHVQGTFSYRYIPYPNTPSYNHIHSNTHVYTNGYNIHKIPYFYVVGMTNVVRY